MKGDGTAYRLTGHAKRRIEKRQLCPLTILATLESGREFKLLKGLVLRYDAHSRYAVVLNPTTRTIVTAFRMRKGQLKRRFSRRNGQKMGVR